MHNETKEVLANALIDILQKRPINKITVKDIVEECGLTRQTFYNYFYDIYELVEWIYLQATEKSLAENKDYDTWQQGFYQLLISISNSKVLVQNTYRSTNRESLERYMYTVIYDQVLAVVERQAIEMSVDQKYKNFIARFYSLAFIALICEWIKDGMKEKPEDIVEQTAVLIKGDFEKALKKYAN
ncbi:TetR/AcrR family transcriptional regulator [Lacrimispora saccharolytica]|uniref:Transcriptional regulator, TetR family n=1 Tax=Lacrimispora saccharolytica (strain ATCC 35040 / DSM 2544 / NRCC 2533 / WM1) TaxID=610130 RepID=D9R1D3_LACSW|nr:TetR/AcrR family transcriptional regulator [Lacrimispora saccharolytica]ADL06456.1 transcriptional regulator, TetR family [[Clostridium] saccharolyticum WM1]QRV19459.1 TetR/AcrR family transcriptional regulator C-terminal domain-containing protein [Lacrimispora saccharolytica]